jgi:hypothetical protein
MRIELPIERLVLHGVSPTDEDAIRRGVVEQLVEAFTDVQPSQLGARTVDTVATTMQPPSEAGPDAWGAAVGASVARALTQPGRS